MNNIDQIDEYNEALKHAGCYFMKIQTITTPLIHLIVLNKYKKLIYQLNTIIPEDYSDSHYPELFHKTRMKYWNKSFRDLFNDFNNIFNLNNESKLFEDLEYIGIIRNALAHVQCIATPPYLVYYPNNKSKEILAKINVSFVHKHTVLPLNLLKEGYSIACSVDAAILRIRSSFKKMSDDMGLSDYSLISGS